MTTAVIVQARLGSKRFPRKVLYPLKGIWVIHHVLGRAKRIGLPVYIATPDIELTDIGADGHLLSPDEDDVLGRYLVAANAYDIDIIMRITADCPLLRPDLCQKVLDLYNESGCSYAAIGWPEGGFPKGYGCEVFSRFTLQLANELATSPEDREHVTPWMQRNVRCKYLQNDKDESHLNYCVDYPEDIPRLEKILDKQAQII